ncbi:MAG: hypothetical protein KDC54_16575 [Lewinella sp.]|nr:hypothetical protein [Lewinella sp.]
MYRTLLLLLPLLLPLTLGAQSVNGYQPLNPADPVHFGGKYFVYRGDTVTLGPRAFFIDGQLTEEQAAAWPYVFNSVNAAVPQLSHGTEAEPMTLYLAPYVYWIDDPDDPAVRVPELGGRTPYGLVIACEWLRFQGLTQDPRNVVLAANRGQTIGAEGNFTLFQFRGDGTRSENLTFGNYCNVDLEFPLKPALNRPRRAGAIVQAQLIHCNGDKIVARNTRFISRLNLCPFVGAKRALFDRCHFESTDDALCGTGVYLRSTFDFYSSKPFYHTRGTGAVFLDCDITAYTLNRQYFTKANGQVAVVDTRFAIDENTYIGWRDTPPTEMRNYQYQVRKNEQAYLIGTEDAASTVDMTGKPLLQAYRFVHDGEVIYNVYNLLRGADDWDPLEQKALVQAAERASGQPLAGLPVQLLLGPSRESIETGQDTLTLRATALCFGNVEQAGVPVQWSVAPEYEDLVKLAPDGSSCQIIPTNDGNETREVLITARTAAGIEAAAVVTVAPAILPPPPFTRRPVIARPRDGRVTVEYQLDIPFEDQSIVTWYRCADAAGRDPLAVAVSRFREPLLTYELTASDVGHYLMVTVAPRHLRCEPGAGVSAITRHPIRAREVTSDRKTLDTDFRHFPTADQPLIRPGAWTLTQPDTTVAAPVEDTWFYGEGRDGASGHRGLLQGRTARLRYTPLPDTYGDMRLECWVAPFKSAGQGFSVAPLYMDVLIKYDAITETGYGLRFIRTTKYHNAVDVLFVRYENGVSTAISEPVSTSCYRTLCHIVLEVKGNRLLARVSSTAELPDMADQPEVVPEVALDIPVSGNAFGGFGIEYWGGAPAVFERMVVRWE